MAKSSKKTKSLTKAEQAARATLACFDEFDLKPQHKLFIIEYVENGGNGVQAYLKTVGKKSTYSPAGANAYKLLKKEKIQKAMSAYLEAVVLSKGFVTSNFYDIARYAKSESARVNATDKLARLTGMYKDAEGESGNGNTLNVQINMSPMQEMKIMDNDTIDVDAKEG
jgi:hypothetical protein